MRHYDNDVLPDPWEDEEYESASRKRKGRDVENDIEYDDMPEPPPEGGWPDEEWPDDGLGGTFVGPPPPIPMPRRRYLPTDEDVLAAGFGRRRMSAPPPPVRKTVRPPPKMVRPPPRRPLGPAEIMLGRKPVGRVMDLGFGSPNPWRRQSRKPRHARRPASRRRGYRLTI